MAAAGPLVGVCESGAQSTPGRGRGTARRAVFGRSVGESGGKGGRGGERVVRSGENGDGKRTVVLEGSGGSLGREGELGE